MMRLLVALAGLAGALQPPPSLSKGGTSLKFDAADAMAEALAGQAFAVPALPVVANVLAEANSDPARVGELLVAQVTGRVRWRESVAWMAGQSVTDLVELGAGSVLAGLTKRIAPEVAAQSVGTAEGLRSFAEGLA